MTLTHSKGRIFTNTIVNIDVPGLRSCRELVESLRKAQFRQPGTMTLQEGATIPRLSLSSGGKIGYPT